MENLLHKRSTVGENIIATTKMRNNFCYPLKMVIIQISLSPLRARKSDNYRYRDCWKSDNFRERAIKKEAKN